MVSNRYFVLTVGLCLSLIQPAKASSNPSDFFPPTEGKAHVRMGGDGSPIAVFYNPHEDGSLITLTDTFYCKIAEDKGGEHIKRAVRLVLANALAAKVDTDRMFGPDTEVWSSTRQRVEEARLRATSEGILDGSCWGQEIEESLSVTLTGNGWVKVERDYLIFVAEAKLTVGMKRYLLYFGTSYTTNEWSEKTRSVLTE